MQADCIQDALRSVLDGDAPSDGLQSAILSPQIGIAMSLESA